MMMMMMINYTATADGSNMTPRDITASTLARILTKIRHSSFQQQQQQQQQQTVGQYAKRHTPYLVLLCSQ